MVVSSVIILAALGLLAALLLGVSSQLLAVEEDPRIEAVVEVLPGANCGGCGFAGCEGYAQAVVKNANVPANLCVAGGEEVGVNVGRLTGKTVAASEPQISYRRCEKNDGKVAVRFQYQGLPSCAAVALLAQGQGSDRCTYSCLGHGDCVQVCPFGALYLRDDLVRVNPARCTGCGQCVKACPRNILHIIPRRARVMMSCSSKDKGKMVTEICQAGCIQCMKCTRKCPAGAFSLVDGNIRVDHKICLAYGDSCGMICVEECPRKIIRCLNAPAVAAVAPHAMHEEIPDARADGPGVSRPETLDKMQEIQS